eukprot:3814237-Prymnesium_polylepis.1
MGSHGHGVTWGPQVSGVGAARTLVDDEDVGRAEQRANERGELPLSRREDVGNLRHRHLAYRNRVG